MAARDVVFRTHAKGGRIRHSVSKMAVDKSLFSCLLLRKNKCSLKLPSSAAKLASKSVDMYMRLELGKVNLWLIAYRAKSQINSETSKLYLTNYNARVKFLMGYYMINLTFLPPDMRLKNT
jgi:hypothetical protein